MTDRYGDMPRPASRLLEVATAKALAEQCGISRIEEKDGNLIFYPNRPNLSLWSEVFAVYRTMRFAPSGDRVIYKLQNTEPSTAALAVMKLYFKAFSDSNHSK